MVVLCVVAGLHSLLIVLVWKARETLYERRATDDQFAVWVRLAPEVRKSVELPPMPAALVTRQTASLTPTAAKPSGPTAETAEAPPTNSTPRQIIWGNQAAYYAKKAVEDSVTDRYRNLGPRKPGPPPERPPPSIFEPEENVLGQEGRDVHGDPVVRLNKYCYQDLDKTVLTARDIVSPRPPGMVNCMFPGGKGEPRGDLFEHLKRNRPLPPAPRPGVPGELPERLEEHEQQ
ncbi:MAG TPA: hypothetical protein VKB34_21695 [Povalibacter sp.]|nr:hypothetical protein [Povalibacter sp.]